MDEKKRKNAENKASNEEQPVRQTGTLRERLSRVKPTRWWRFGIVSAIFIGWVAWLGSWWVILFWPLLADIYLTQFIPWNAWKFSKNKTVRAVMSWVDAIVYALVLVYFIFLFIGQNYQIPSSSLEKTLLTGDYLWVNKMVYGPRVPETPLHFPLAQNTLFGCKSYIEKPQWEYHRLKGVRSVERYDIVVFNFPAADTVYTANGNNPYYYQAAVSLGIQALQQQGELAASSIEQLQAMVVENYERICSVGSSAIKTHPEQFGDVLWRPVDRRDAYVKRCVGLPGEKLQIRDGIVYIDGKALPEPENMQRNYELASSVPDEILDQIKVSQEARQNPMGMPLTRSMQANLAAQGYQSSLVADTEDDILFTYPMNMVKRWTHNNYGPVWIPKKGETLQLTLQNLPVYERCIRNYENNSLETRDGKIYINGKISKSYTFKLDYYWMMGDNRDNSSDSRYWGFVPEDHVIGTPMFVIVSFDPDKSFLSGKIRWNRIFKDANPDK